MGFQIVKDIIDILLVAILLYETYKLLKKSGAASVFVGVFAFILVWFLVSRVFEMQLLGGLFDKVINVGAIALIVIFQDEIRMFFSGDTVQTSERLSRWMISSSAARPSARVSSGECIPRIAAHSVLE